MQEKLLSYLWQTQQFTHKRLVTTTGVPIQILHRGELNENAGPDFSGAEVEIDGVLWHGHVELHVRASQWRAHRHHEDAAYENVVLHVVWEEDQVVCHKEGVRIPTLRLQDYVPKRMLKRYEQLMNASVQSLPCAPHVASHTVAPLQEMLYQRLHHRLLRKETLLAELFEENQQDSQATAFQWLAYTLGAPINSHAFLALAQRLPWKLVQRVAPNLLHIEALLLGQAGFLEEGVCHKLGDYPKTLWETYAYLQHKHRLKPPLSRAYWKFFRLRPANFPTIRLAQLAALLHRHPQPFYLLLNSSVTTFLKELFLVQSPYWRMHYLVGKKSQRPIPGLGKATIYHLIINATVPLLSAYGTRRGEYYYHARARELLEKVPAEHHRITKLFSQTGTHLKSAAHSQGAIELYQTFCRQHRCLDCAVGKAILRPASRGKRQKY